MHVILYIWMVIVAVTPRGHSASIGSTICGGVAICGDDQYCSAEEHPRCVPCSDVVDTCFTQDQPFNCTNHCLDHYLQTKRNVECPMLGGVLNGRHNGSTRMSPGDVIKVTCREGHQVNGSSIIRCLPFGMWSDDLPSCEEIICVPPAVEHGSVEDSYNRNVGSVVKYMCDEGYTAVDKQAECQDTGVWKSLYCAPYPVTDDKPDVTWMAVAIALICAVIIIIIAAFIIVCYVYKVYKEDDDVEAKEKFLKPGNENTENPGVSISDSQSEETKLMTLANDTPDCLAGSVTNSSHTSHNERTPSPNVQLTLNINGSTVTVPGHSNIKIRSDTSDSTPLIQYQPSGSTPLNQNQPSGSMPLIQSQTSDRQFLIQKQTAESMNDNSNIKHPVQVSEYRNGYSKNDKDGTPELECSGTPTGTNQTDYTHEMYRQMSQPCDRHKDGKIAIDRNEIVLEDVHLK